MKGRQKAQRFGGNNSDFKKTGVVVVGIEVDHENRNTDADVDLINSV